MSETVWHFFAAGKPATKGSTRSFAHSKTGAIVTMGDNKRTHTWEGIVAHAASEAGVRKAERGAGVSLRLTFYLTRPKGHYGTGRNAQRLKPSAAPAPAKKPDIDKLARAVLDALHRVAYVDDSQVISLEARKVFAELGSPEGVQVCLERVS